MRVEELGLIDGPAKRAAGTIAATFPGTVFTSGRRDAVDQARAMAQNIVHNRHWIVQTYRSTEASIELQRWVNSNPVAQNVDTISTGLLSTMFTWTDEKRRELSKHFSGEAFDIAPVAGELGERMKAFIHKLPGIKFLEEEGGLIRWHVQAN